MVEYLIASLRVPTRHDEYDEEIPDDGYRDADDVFLSMLDCKFYVSDTAQYKQWDLLTSPSIPKALLSSCPQYRSIKLEILLVVRVQKCFIQEFAVRNRDALSGYILL